MKNKFFNAEAETFSNQIEQLETKGPRVLEIKWLPRPRAVLGIIQVPTDLNMDMEAPLLINQFMGVELRMQKARFRTTNGSALCCADTFLENQDRIEEAASVVKCFHETLCGLPYLTICGLACTSMSYTLGAETVDAQLAQGSGALKTTDMARSQLRALQFLGTRRVALITPYVKSLHQSNINFLQEESVKCGNKVDVVCHFSFNLSMDMLTSRVSFESIKDEVFALLSHHEDKNVDVVVIGCSAFRIMMPGLISQLESDIYARFKKQIYVVTSAQAFFWNMLRSSGILDVVDGYGALFHQPVSSFGLSSV
jgi:maleate isomerase